MGVGSLATLGEAVPTVDRPGDPVPHVVAWNLTRRCNLRCAHCYISAGPRETATGELGTDECLRIAGEILEVNPAPMFILSGGEPLMRDDLTTIADFAASRGATVVVGTNGTLLTDAKIEELKSAGVMGVAVSIESLEPRYHDRFRRGHGSHAATMAAVDRLGRHHLDFVIQTTVTQANRSELPALVRWAADQGAVSFNAYFLVPTGRGARMSDLPPAASEEALTLLVDLHLEYLGRMMIRAKCAPAFMRLVHQRAPESPVLQYSTRCPCGVQYCRVTPDGHLTACPYLPLPAGDLRRDRFAAVWSDSALFATLRDGELGGKCGRCQYRLVCGGCRASAYARTGDVLAEDASCAYQPNGDEAPLVPGPRVTYGKQRTPELQWSPEASERLRRIPSFVRGVVVARVEDYAARHGHSVVTVDLMREVRRSMPVDFSKRLPFFLRDD